MKLIDQFYRPETIDCYTFVFDEVDPRTKYYTMLGTSALGWTFSQWTSGVYDLEGPNEHLGERVEFSGLAKMLIDHVLSRIEE